MSTTSIDIDPASYQKFCAFIYEQVGIKLGDKKEALVSTRVGKRMRALAMDDFKAYMQFVKTDPTGNELVQLLDAISTNTTHFFREGQHFKRLKQILQSWEAAGQREFRIWCAASSTGEEPYTIAMTVKESLRNTRDTKILATDISTEVLGIARAGTYDMKRINSLPEPMRNKYFTKIPGNGPEDTKFQANQDLQSMIKFGRLNLSVQPYPLKGPFDVILCRNVMIYFDNAVRTKLLGEFNRLLRPGGYLMVGHSESLSGLLSNFKSIEPAVYTK